MEVKGYQRVPTPTHRCKLALITLRYHPPGMGLTYVDPHGKRKEMHLDLLNLHYGSDTSEFAEEILSSAPIVQSPTYKRKVLNGVEKLKENCNFDYSKKYVSFTVIKPHSLPLTDACFSRSGMKCVTSSLGNACKVWCCLTGSEIGPLACHTDAVTSVNMSPEGDNILTSSHDGTVRHWYHNDKDGYAFCSHTIPVCCNKGKVLFAKYSPDFKKAVSGTSEKTICVLDLEKGSILHRLTVDMKNSHAVSCTGFNRSGEQLLGSPYAGTKVALWDVRSGEMITLLSGHSGVVNKSAFNFTGTLIGTTASDCTVKVWDVRRTDNPLYSLRDVDSEVGDLEFDPRGNKLAGGTKQGQLILWDVQETGKTLFRTKVESGPILKVQWSPNGALVMTSNITGTLKLYHSEMGNCVQTIPEHTREIVNAAFSYSSDYLMTASKDKTVRIYKHTSI